MKHLLWLLTFLLLGCGREKSDLKIVGGENVQILPGQPEDHLPFLIGIEIVPQEDLGKRTICSGFRYGYDKVITSGRCVRKSLSFKDQQEVENYDPLTNIGRGAWIDLKHVSVISAGGYAGTGAATAMFHPKFGDFCAMAMTCPDIAMLRLDKSIADSEYFIRATDPALIGTAMGFYVGNFKLSAAGMGCNKGDYPGEARCQITGAYFNDFATYPTDTNGFQSYSYSIWREMSVYPIAPYYRAYLEKEWMGEDYYYTSWANNHVAFASGDSGAPIFHEAANPVTYRADDVARYTVEAIALFTPEFNRDNNKEAQNVSLALGHQSILSWIMDLTRFDTNPTKDPEPPRPGVICNPNLLDPNINYQRTNLSNIPDAQFTADFDEELKTRLRKDLKYPIIAMNMAGCFRTTFEKINELEQAYAGKNKDEAYHNELGRLEYLNFLNYMYLETTIEWQDAIEVEKARLLKEARNQLWKSMRMALDTSISFLPYIGVIKDVTYIITGKNWLTGEELKPWERGLGAALVVIPGLMHGAELTDDALRIYEGQVDTASRLGRYSMKVGRFTQKVKGYGNKLNQAPGRLLALFREARGLNYKNYDEITSLIRTGAVLNPACAAAVQFLSMSPAPQPQWYNPLEWLVPTAYASNEAACLSLAHNARILLQKTYAGLSLNTAEEICKAAGKHVPPERILEVLTDMGKYKQLDHVRKLLDFADNVTPDMMKVAGRVADKDDFMATVLKMSNNTPQGTAVSLNEGIAAARYEMMIQRKLARSPINKADFKDGELLISLKGPLMSKNGKPIPSANRVNGFKGLKESIMEPNDKAGLILVDLYGLKDTEITEVRKLVPSLPVEFIE